MQFLLQLPISSLPAGAGARGDGVLQLFYCSLDDGHCETWRPFVGANVVRLLRGPMVKATPPPGIAAFAPRSVERWSEFVDYPHPEEHETLGLAYAYDFKGRRVTVSCDELGIALRDLDVDANVEETIADAEQGDKLGGWPYWIQSAEYPGCPQCGSVMKLVLQIDSENNVPHMFGDAGCGHITQCPVHPDVLAFGWACS